MKAAAAALVWLLPHLCEADSSVQDALREANTLLQQGRFEQASHELLEVTKRYPTSAQAFALLGIAQIQLHDLTAETSFRHALELDPRCADALYNLGVLSLEHKHPGQAIAYFERVRRLGPVEPELAVNLVRAYLDAGNPQDSLKIAEEGQKSFRDSPAFHLALGKAFLAHGMLSEAVASLKAADSLAPSQPEALLPLADACLRLPDLPCTQDALTKAARVSENNPRYWITLARYHQKEGQQQSAMAELQRAAQLAPDLAEVPYGLAVSSFIQDDYKGAIDFSTKTLKLDPVFDRAIFLLAISRFALSQLSDAEDLLRKAIQLQPWNAFYHCFLGMVRLSADRWTDAAANFREAIRLRPAYALAHYQLGRTMVRTKNFAEARQELERAVKLQPSLGEAYYQLGLTYRHLGESQKAVDAMAAFTRFRTDQQNERSEILRQAQQSIQGQP